MNVDSRPWHELRLDEVVARWAVKAGNQTALENRRQDSQEDSITWSELDNAISAKREELKALGLNAGDRCAVVLEDSISCLVVVYAVFRVGMILVPVDSEWGEELRNNILRQAGAQVVLHSTSEGWQTKALRAGPAQDIPLDSKVAMISYTSGSTSDPKGVILCHHHLRSVYMAAAGFLRKAHGRDILRYACAMRLSGLGVMGIHYLLAAELGASMLILDELTVETAGGFWATAITERIDILYLVPALVELLLVRSAVSERTSRSITILCGGAPLRAEAQSRFQDRFPARLLNVYGTTEMACAIFFGDIDGRGMGTNSIGTPVLGSARLRRPDGGILDGQSFGTLEVTGPSMARGYWQNHLATSESFVNGWYLTGDLAERDGSGRYFHRGRQKDIVLRGAFTIYFAEVEDALMSFEEVADACAVRLREGTIGEDVGAIVVAAQGERLDTDDLVARAAHFLGAARAPRWIVISDDPIPRVSNGKVDRRAAQRLWSQLTS